MIAPDNPHIAERANDLWQAIKAQGVDQWAREKPAVPELEDLVYLCRFAYFTGIITKARLSVILELDSRERKSLVKSWYDLHRSRGCGTC